MPTLGFQSQWESLKKGAVVYIHTQIESIEKPCNNKQLLCWIIFLLHKNSKIIVILFWDINIYIWWIQKKYWGKCRSLKRGMFYFQPDRHLFVHRCLIMCLLFPQQDNPSLSKKSLLDLPDHGITCLHLINFCILSFDAPTSSVTKWYLTHQLKWSGFKTTFYSISQF